MTPNEGAAPSSGEGGDALPDANASAVAELNGRIGELNDQITEKSRELSAELAQQSVELKQLEDARARQSELQRAADEARTKLQAAEIRKSDLGNVTADRIRELLELHSAIVAQMAISAAEAAGPSAPTQGMGALSRG